MEKTKKFGITTLILIALGLGIVTGVVLHSIPPNYVTDEILINGVFLVLGNGFINLLKMIVVPLVFASLVTGTMSMGDTKKIGRIGVKVIAIYLLTTVLAITIALVIASITDPGVGFDISQMATTSDIQVVERESLTTTLLNFIPNNPIAAMADGDMIPIIIFSLIFGVGISKLSDDHPVIATFFKDLNDVMINITLMIMKLAPIGVFCLISRTFATLGADAIFGLIKYFLTVILALGVQCFVVYSMLLFLFTGLSPLKFFKKFGSVMAFAFSASSSNATIPVSIESLEKNFGVDRELSSFTVPLGATINMDGTSIMQGVAVIFTAQAFGIDLTVIDLLTVVATATVASIGTAGIPSSGLVMLSMVLSSVGLPVEAIAIIMGIDRLVDMTRTAVNITGDAVCTTIIAKQENYIDIDKFNEMG